MTPFYSRWFGSFFPQTPNEPLSTCSNCAMVGCTSNASKDPGPFDQNLKCCTYFPFLPGFSIAELLHNKNEAAISMMSSTPEEGVLVPLGLFPDGNRRFRQSESEDFGRDPKLTCPFLKKGACTVWEQRPSVCASYHCFSTAGDRGLQFWWTHEQLGNQLEWILAHEILWRIGFTEDDTNAMIEAAQDGEGVEETWGEWRNRKPELFAKIRETALTITPDEIRELAGEEGAALSVDLRELAKAFTSKSV
jgi:Fe-S-cluster containining protein